MRPGDETIVLASGERVVVRAILDAAGTLLVQDRGGDSFQLDRTQVMSLHEKHAGCGCCGG